MIAFWIVISALLLTHWRSTWFLSDQLALVLSLVTEIGGQFLSDSGGHLVLD